MYPRVIELMLGANKGVWQYLPEELETIQIGTYTAGEAGYYDWHVDRSTSGGLSQAKKVDRVLSGSIQLSDPSLYEGGALLVGPVTAPREQGSLVIFPSYAMHTVRPVTSGVRYSLVLWLQGRGGTMFESDAIASHISAISSLRPNEPPAMQVLLGESLLKLGRRGEAMTATRRAIELGGGTMDGSGLAVGGEGMTDAGRARARYNGGVILWGLMQELSDGSKAEEALEMFTAAIRHQVSFQYKNPDFLSRILIS